MDLVRATAKLFGAKAGSTVLSFLGTVYFVRELGAASMGVFFLFHATLSLLGIVADAGLAGALEKRVSEGDAAGQFLSGAIALKALPVGLVVVCVLAARAPVDAYVGAEVAGLLAVGVVLQEAARTSTAALKGELRVGETAVLEVARVCAWIGVGVVLVHRGLGTEALAYGHLAGLLAKFGWSAAKCSVAVERPSVEAARSLVRYARFDALSSIGGFVYSWFDVLVIGFLLTEAHVGAYEVAWRVSSIVPMLSYSLGLVLFPQISSWDAADARERIEDAVRDSISASLALSIPALFGCVLLSRELLGVVFGPEFERAWFVLVVLVGVNVAGSVNHVLDNALRGLDRPDLVAYTTATTITANLLFNVPLVHAFGIDGAAAATGSTIVIAVLLNAAFLSEFVSVEFPGAVVGYCVAAAGAMSVVVLALRTVVPVVGPLSLAAVVAAGAIVYFCSLLAYAPFRERTRGEFRSLREAALDS